MTMSAADFLDQWFETDVLKATMSASGIIGTFLGVRSPGTAYVLLHHYMGEIDGAFRSWGFARGGTGAISNAIAAAAREAGVEIRTQAPIAKITRQRTARSGVVLENGDEIDADRRLLERRSASDLHEDDRRERACRRFCRRRPALQVPRLLRQGQPRARRRCPISNAMPGPGAHLRGAISISPCVEYMERAYDDAKYGRFSRRPYIDMVIPSLTDPSRRAAGQARDVLLRAIRALQTQGTEPGTSRREDFGDTVIDTIAEHAPNIKNIILHRQVLTPLDLERDSA